jgi:hypothetical protein
LQVLKIRLLIVAVVAALAVPAASLGAARNVVIDVVITDRGIVLGEYTNNQVADISSMTPLMGPLYKKDDVHFVVFNRSKKSQNFSVFGRTTSTIRPGGSAKFEQRPPHAGKFPYKSTLASGPSFRGILTVR